MRFRSQQGAGGGQAALQLERRRPLAGHYRPAQQAGRPRTADEVLPVPLAAVHRAVSGLVLQPPSGLARWPERGNDALPRRDGRGTVRSEEHTSELQSLMRISYAVFCLTKKKQLTK